MIKRLLIRIGGPLIRAANKKRRKPLFDLNSFFTLSKVINIKENKKIKIRFLHFSGGLWYAIGGIVRLFINDEKYDVKIIIENRNDYYGAIKECINAGVDYCLVNKYNVEKDKPDIFIFYYPSKFTSIRKLKENCKLVICVAFTIFRYSYSADVFWKSYKSYIDYNPDYFLFDKLLYNDLYKNGQYKNKLILAGAQIYDELYRAACREKKSFRNFSKLNNKRTLLWATDHGVYYSKISNDITFDLYADTIFDYFDKHKDIGLIFRPHPTFIKEMLKHGYWTLEDIEKIKSLFNKTDNMIFDDSYSVTDALAYCDALIVDAFCSVSTYAYPLHKPIGLLYRNKKLKPFHKELDDSLLSIRCKEDLIIFLDKFNNDYENLRKTEFNDDEIFCYFDGNNNVRAKEIIEEKYKLLNK